jgi:hypothetical protein
MEAGSPNTAEPAEAAAALSGDDSAMILNNRHIIPISLKKLRSLRGYAYFPMYVRVVLAEIHYPERYQMPIPVKNMPMHDIESGFYFPFDFLIACVL